MKLVVVGLGQCGGRIADQFAWLNMKARGERRFDLISSIIAVNTDMADLSGLKHIKPDKKHRILIGAQKSGGHGVGKINELGAQVAREDADVVLEAMTASQQFPEADAFLLIAGAAGGTGSGSIPVLTQVLKERFPQKPVYDLIVLPFRSEELTEKRVVYNVATCLKSAYLVADAVLLVDNQNYYRGNSPINRALFDINKAVVEPFYNLLSAGEEKISDFVGGKTLDAGDIIQTLSGWAVLGHGQAEVPRHCFFKRRDFRTEAIENHPGMLALERSVSGLSLRCNPEDAKKGLYLISAPAAEMSMELFKEVGARLRSLAPDAIIRSGDYPRQKGAVEVTIILAELLRLDKLTDYFKRAIEFIYTTQRGQENIDQKHREFGDLFGEIPSLI